MPAADPTVAYQTQQAVLGLQTSALGNLATLIPVAAVLLVSVAVVFFVLNKFRGIAKI